MNCELFVGNLPYSITEQDLTKYFGSAGKVESVKIITDMHTGRSRGYGFIKMESEEAAAKAIEDLNGKDYEGRPLKVNEAGAERRTNSGPRQGGGYRPREGNGGGQGGGYRPRDDRPREGGAGGSGDRRPRSW